MVFGATPSQLDFDVLHVRLEHASLPSQGEVSKGSLLQ